jgi:hypothetical protein
VKEWVKLMQDGNEICFQHSKNIASTLGMQTRTLNAVTVKERLHAYHQAALNSLLGSLKVDKETYSWFRRAARPERPSDALGPYKVMPRESKIFSIDAEDQANLCRHFKIDTEEWDKVFNQQRE